MLLPNISPKFNSDIPFIVDGYTILHYDEEPILFSGFNKFGNRILGSSIESNLDEKFDYFFHLILDEYQYIDFLKKKVSYRKLLEDVATFFLVKISFDSEIQEAYIQEYALVPQEYLPAIDSFCPERVKDTSLDYAVVLDGGEANKHLANPEKVNLLAKKFKELFEAAIASLSIPGYDLNFCMSGGGFVKSSFKINFNIGLNFNRPVHTLFYDDLRVFYSDFLKSYVEYAVTDLSQDISQIVAKNTDSTSFQEILKKGKEVAEKEGRRRDIDFDSKFLAQIEKSAISLNEISQTLGDGYNTIEISNILKDGSENVLGIIDEGYRESLETAVVELQVNSDNIFRDANPTNYNIHIESLSFKNRSGTAAVHQANPDAPISKPSFKIQGKEVLHGTIFTESMHFNKYISVNAIGTKDKDGKILKLEIQFPENEK